MYRGYWGIFRILACCATLNSLQAIADDCASSVDVDRCWVIEDITKHLGFSYGYWTSSRVSKVSVEAAGCKWEIDSSSDANWRRWQLDAATAETQCWTVKIIRRGPQQQSAVATLKGPICGGVGINELTSSLSDLLNQLASGSETCGVSAAARAGATSAQAFFVADQKFVALQLWWPDSEICLTLYEDLVERGLAAIFRPRSCLLTEQAARAEHARLFRMMSITETWVGVSLDTSFFGAKLSSNGLGEAVVSGFPKNKIDSWLSAVSAAANARYALPKDDDPLPGVNDDAYLGRLSRWLAAAAWRLSEQPFAQPNQGNSGLHIKESRDWMSRAAVISGTNTVIRGEVLRDDWYR